ncbi:2-amino-4-hydroxy-6-hydroxymethyldihydropteridine diphosphokinase [Pedobacter sp. ASV28]|uniref:2-amino-4-hydroxy-6- hydroxymethyldihydropteridine diphosphokinase n=1 Tax=Pedobacter sp. ASV28 TaxID=2795123 RepID=UPI001E3B3B35|nr:2-amino-4-hydroxy-6-hydroxymethyldihydropteridine diphosphokinase [Pedobacter sp. ASV28]
MFITATADMELDNKRAYLLLGSNLGDKWLNLSTATKKIAERVGHVFAKSSIYETAAWGKTDQPGFFNQAIGVETKLSALQTLRTILDIEQDMGRIRKEKWGARLIDIDLIFYADEVIDNEELQLPHPQMHHRKFVLVPLNEIAENFTHPIFNQKVSDILTNLTDELAVQKIQPFIDHD